MKYDERACKFNMDTGCVELLLRDGRKISIDCTGIEDALDVTMAQQTELDYLIYNDPLGYFSLIDINLSIRCMSAFRKKLLSRFPESRIKVQKSQISYYNRHLYACVSFLKVKKKSELPEDYFVLTLGLPALLESDRVAVKTDPYPGRWTTHFVISSPSDLDEELFDWIGQAYQFAQSK